MKTRFFLTLLAVAALAFSCGEKDPDVPGPGPGPGPVNPTELRVSLPDDGGPLSVYRWSAEDYIRVGDANFPVKEGAGSMTAVFDGAPQKDNYYSIAYPEDITGVDSYLSYFFGGQIQKGNAMVEHLIPTVYIEDVTTCENVTLSEAWATSNGGTFRTNGAVQFYFKLPADAGVPTAITLEAAGVEFPVNNAGDRKADKLELQIREVPANVPFISAYLSVSEQKVEIPANSLKVTLVGDNTYTYMVPEAVEMGGGILTEITVSDASLWEGYVAMTGEGTEASPYILMTPDHLMQMNELVKAGEMVWFELGDDIDMLGTPRWIPLNFESPYSKAVHFDGKGHKISNFKCTAGDYPSFFGVLNGTVKDVIFDNAVLDGSGKAGVIAGYCGTNIGTNDAPVYIKATVTGVTVQNSKITADNYAGGLFGQVNSPSVITNCHAKNIELSSGVERVGGLIGQAGVNNLSVGATITDCTTENVKLQAPRNVGGFVGVCYNNISRCSSSGNLTHTVAYEKEVSVGGFAGHIENCTVTDCSSSAVVNCTLDGRSLGGFVGVLRFASTVERCSASGNVTGIARNDGGFAGLLQPGAGNTVTVRNCYSTGDVTANSYMGGFFGLIDKEGDVLIENCYATGKVTASAFAAGGFAGHIGQNPGLTIKYSVAWNSEVTADNHGASNWSSGAFGGVTHPKCTLTDNYRNPSATLTMYWVPASDYQHPNVSPEHPLVQRFGTEEPYTYAETTATIAGGGQQGYPQFPYHGKVESGKTLSQLASQTLGWSSSVWDFSGELPTLKK